MELLAPAGNYEAFLAAISNGADAIYVGLKEFGARAYADNFDLTSLKQITDYAHLRKVKIYVTLNINIYEDELESVYNIIDQLAIINIDGIIFFDLAVLDYITTYYKNLEAHASTQTGIDNVYAGLFFKKNKVKRLVLARELSLEEIKEIKNKTKLEVEVFIHGALCIAYSGNCLMSGLIGQRSGNRGRCVGSCRKEYTLIDKTNNKTYPKSYLLSTKDLKTIDSIKDLLFIDSLKIEGRMKEPTYVANIVSCYKEAIIKNNLDYKNLNERLLKTFQRTFTKGYILNELPKDITNITRPNNFGYNIGEVISVKGEFVKIKLTDELNQFDQIRIANSREVIFPVIKIYDTNNNLIKQAKNICILKMKENVKVKDKVYKIKDAKFLEDLKKTYPKEYNKFPINFYVTAKLQEPLNITINFEDIYISKKSNLLLEKSTTSFLTKEKLYSQLDKLNDSPYMLNSLEAQLEDNLYISIKEINNLRRELIDDLNKKRLENKNLIKNKEFKNKPITFEVHKPVLACYAQTKEQEEAILEEGINIIYTSKNTIRRNQSKYLKNDSKYLLVGGYGGIEYYNQKEIISDFTLNVTNSRAIYKLHSSNVKRVTISHELSKDRINNMINAYYKNNNGFPNLEMIVYGYTQLMFTKYCPLKKFELCGKCKTNSYFLKDDIATFRVISNDDCSTIILNSKRLNLIDDLNSLKNINVFRLQFSTETKEETKNIIKMFKEKLDKIEEKTSYFNSLTDTRGHFNKIIL